MIFFKIFILYFLLNFTYTPPPCFTVVDKNGVGIPYASIMDTKYSFSTFTDDKGYFCLDKR